MPKLMTALYGQPAMGWLHMLSHTQTHKLTYRSIHPRLCRRACIITCMSRHIMSRHSRAQHSKSHYFVPQYITPMPTKDACKLMVSKQPREQFQLLIDLYEGLLSRRLRKRVFIDALEYHAFMIQQQDDSMFFIRWYRSCSIIRHDQCHHKLLGEWQSCKGSRTMNHRQLSLAIISDH